jgi:hypothetical protein
VQPLAAHDILSLLVADRGLAVDGRTSFAGAGAADATGAGSEAAPIAGAAVAAGTLSAEGALAGGGDAGSAVADGAFEHAVASATASAA